MATPGDFLRTLHQGRFLLDGGMGSSLLKLGLKSQDLAVASRRRPALVEDVHRSYLLAGSQVIQTNSFGANRLALERLGVTVDPWELNRAAARLARGVVREHGSGWVAGNLGQASAWANSQAEVGEPLLEEIYGEQAAGLLSGGIDFWSLETFGDADEACLALRCLKRVRDLPVLVSFTFVEDKGAFRTLSGERLVHALLRLEEAGAEAVGVNCARGSAQTLECVRSLAGHLRVPLCAKPNAGLPIQGDGGVSYSQSPEEFARDMLEATRLGASAVGGCCGADASFLRALRDALDGSP